MLSICLRRPLYAGGALCLRRLLRRAQLGAPSQIARARVIVRVCYAKGLATAARLGFTGVRLPPRLGQREYGLDASRKRPGGVAL